MQNMYTDMTQHSSELLLSVMSFNLIVTRRIKYIQMYSLYSQGLCIPFSNGVLCFFLDLLRMKNNNARIYMRNVRYWAKFPAIF